MLTRPPLSPNVCLLLVLLVFSSQDALSHKQPVHQYIAREGYALLLQKAGHDIPALSAGLGLADPSFAGDSAWQKGCITTGAWREDEEDVVYHFDILPGLNYPLTSITHFWVADQGDYTQNMFRLMVDHSPFPPVATDIGPFHNTFDKMVQFAHGGWTFWYPRAIICQNTSNNHYLIITPVIASGGFGIPLEYAGLTSFYKSSRLRVRAEQPSACVVLDVNDLKSINLSDVTEIKVWDEVRNIVAWEILGRMCHLLGDMSIPAHVHRDEHGLNPDSYEDYVGGAGDPYKQWDHTNAGAPFILNGPSDEVLHFLMCVTQQQSDHFGSNGPSQGTGNDVVGGDACQAEKEYLKAVNLGSLAGPTTDVGPWSIENLNLIRDRTMPVVIQATAGLLYWFCHETGMVESLAIAPTITRHPLACSAKEGKTATFSVVVSGTFPFTYQWEKNRVAIAEAVSASYTTPATQLSDDGAQFRCVVRNLADTVTSDPASLSVLPNDVDETPAQPMQYSLAQNYPNPFNPLTAIKYTIAGSRDQGSGVSAVKLAVHDLLGREVATLVDERKVPGMYDVSFDASGLASGVYIYRLTVGSYTESRRMLLIR